MYFTCSMLNNICDNTRFNKKSLERNIGLAKTCAKGETPRHGLCFTVFLYRC